jgi:hypothetical protein
MQSGNKFLSVLAAGFVLLAFVLKTVVPQTLFRIGLGNRFYRPDSLAFWVFLLAGFVVGIIVLLKIIVRGLILR